MSTRTPTPTNSHSARPDSSGGLRLHNTVKRHRERRGWSQQTLADRVDVSRQAVSAIEAGRQVPSTLLGLRLASALGCRVEDLFRLLQSPGLSVTLPPAGLAPDGAAGCGARVAVGSVAGRWVAHRLALDASVGADAVVASQGAASEAIVQPLGSLDTLAVNVLAAGCAPPLGALAKRVAARFADARVTWLPASSRRALGLLDAKLVHVAGVHLSNAGLDHPGDAAQGNIDAVTAAFPGENMLLVNLTRWRQGMVVAAGNPLAIRTPADLCRPGLRVACREPGSGAFKLIAQRLADEGCTGQRLTGPSAAGHADVARLVGCGAADVGVAIESVALAAGLDFVPLAEERFDLVVPASLAATPPVARLIDVLDDPGFRTEMSHVPGYDSGLSGHVTTLDGC